jgi:hypothetical protein
MGWPETRRLRRAKQVQHDALWFVVAHSIGYVAARRFDGRAEM